jgi:PAS domain S-box-containing protein
LIPFEASVSYISYKGGTAVQGILRDITERKSAEEGLKQMLSLLQSTLESTADGILLVDLSGHIVTYNKRFAAMWKMPESFLLSASEDDVMAFILKQLKEPDLFVATVQGIAAHPEAESFDILELTDGRVFERYSIPQRTEGTVVGRAWSFRDVTERKHAEEALRKSEEQYRSLFTESKDVIFITTPEGRFLDINPAGVELFGYGSREELMNVSIPDALYVHSSDREAYRKTLDQQRFVKDFELILRKKTGELLTVWETATAVMDEHNRVVAYRGIIRDITERKHLESQLRQAQKLQSIGTLAGGIAHDFNNILGIILGHIARIDRDKTNLERVAQSVEAIQKAVERGTALVRQLLTFARQSPIQLESVNVNTVVEEVAKMLSETFPKTITFVPSLAQPMPSIIADSNQLHQALLNLCLNAKDAMPNGGQLSISTALLPLREVRERFPAASDEQYVCLTVRDTGIGMDRATRSRIFEPFFTTKRRSSGTGLGLAVVYGIVESHRGFVNVESEPDRGTAFQLYFPVLPGIVQEHKEETKHEQALPRGKETILVVEDEQMLMELLRSTLEGQGYRVLTATDGVEAVHRYREHKDEIALVLSDLGLPRLGGLDAFREIRNINPNATVIFASGYLDHSLKAQLSQEQTQDFIPKPYNPDTVLRRVREILDRQAGKR